MITLLSGQTWGTVTAMFVAVTALGGVVYGAWSSRQAANRSTDIQGQAQVVDNYSQLVEDGRAARVELRARVEKMEDRMEKLEKRLADSERRYGMAIRYIRQLLGWIAQRLPEVQPPAVPVGIARDLDQ